jgi:tryptophan synthase alpha subunit
MACWWSTIRRRSARGFAALKQSGLDPIFLLAPTSTEKRFDDVALIGSSGYIYYVSLKGVTGFGYARSR